MNKVSFTGVFLLLIVKTLIATQASCKSRLFQVKKTEGSTKTSEMSCTVITSTIVHWIFPSPVTPLTADSNAHKASHTTGLTSAQICNWLFNV